jgi:hypothetical protein
MARRGSAFTIDVDDTDVQTLLRALSKVDADLRKSSNARLREAAKECAGQLKVALYQAIPSSPAPQTRLVAASIKVKSDRTPVVQIGGPKKVGRPYKSRKGGTVRAPAGQLLWGVEYGDKDGRFAERNTDGHWIKPTVKAFGESTKAIDTYKAAVVQILNDAGVL